MKIKDNEFFKEWGSEPFSVKFWNIIVLLILVISGIFAPLPLLVVELLLGSIITIGLVIDNYTDRHYWIMLMPIFWILFLLVIVGIGIAYTISKFDDLIDKKWGRNK